MKLLKNVLIVLILILSVVLTGCLIDTDSKNDPYKEMVTVITEPILVAGEKYGHSFPLGEWVQIQPYSIGKYEVTQKFYEEVMGYNPSYFNENKKPAEGEEQELRPVEKISWYMATFFCNELSKKEGLEPCYVTQDENGNVIERSDLYGGYRPPAGIKIICDMNKNGYRLPTSAEWEFAARGGDQNADDWNSSEKLLSNYGFYEYDYSWFEKNSNNKTHQVGKKLANRLGIFDMRGNVFEWCNDEIEGYANHTDLRVMRGGDWTEDYKNGDLAYKTAPAYIDDRYYGFRLARSIQVVDNQEVNEKENNVLVPVITETTTIYGDQSNGVFPTGRTVTLSPYAIGKYEVTQKMFQEIMGRNPGSPEAVPAEGDKSNLCPVENVSWVMAITFCNKLSIKEGLEPCYSVKNLDGNEILWRTLLYDDILYDDIWDVSSRFYKLWSTAVCDMSKNGYRLPTEAEWEFAARGGSQNAVDWNYIYSGSDNIDEVAVYRTDKQDEYDGILREVGKKKANRLGLYDMSGNVSEWCFDSWGNDFFGYISNNEIVTNPIGTPAEGNKVIRGGCYLTVAKDDFLKVNSRRNTDPFYTVDGHGFRLARSITE